jgi:hypothetical protein
VLTAFWIVATISLQWREIRCDRELSRDGCPRQIVSETPIDLSKLSDAELIALRTAGGDFSKLTDEMRKSILVSLGPDSGWRADRIISPAPPRYEKFIDDAAPIVGPPLLLLLVGGLLYWAVRGFR